MIQDRDTYRRYDYIRAFELNNQELMQIAQQILNQRKHQTVSDKCVLVTFGNIFKVTWFLGDKNDFSAFGYSEARSYFHNCESFFTADLKYDQLISSMMEDCQRVSRIRMLENITYPAKYPRNQIYNFFSKE